MGSCSEEALGFDVELGGEADVLMAATLFSMHDIVLEQKERTRKSSKADVERFIEESELEITSLESQISALIELCDRKRACVAALRHLISPIHTLPVELLAEIFELGIRDYMHMKDAFRISQIYLGSSRIGDRNQVYTDGLKAWLVRSAPLTISVSLVMERRREDLRVPDEILKTSPRWHSLRLIHRNSVGHTPSSLISQLAECKLESLRELSLGSFAERVDPTSFTNVPQLRTLSIDIHSNVLPILVPWAQLTDLTLDAVFPDIVLDVLGQCTNLIRAVVNTTGWDVPPEAGRNIIVLSHLHVLSFDVLGSEGHVTPFLDHLSTPVLENLALDFEGIDDDVGHWTQAHVTAFQMRAPNIAQLDLRCLPLT
ncbi:hypothetical protein B0H12DRAFT_1067896 [Mycena haematopus]|nr:hypothetical protein B0H12DRAFT_1067896 [Mycena haematopus]